MSQAAARNATRGVGTTLSCRGAFGERTSAPTVVHTEKDRGMSNEFIQAQI